MFLVNNSNFSAQIISRTALVIAMTAVINQIHFFKMPQGGDVGFGTMIPLILLACCYGCRITLLAGFICGFIGLIMNPYFYHPVQVLFDYPFPFMAMAVVSLFKKRIFLGTVIAFCVKFLFHFISGVVFFGSYAPEGISPVMYSAVYNGTTVVPEMIICCLILHFLPTKRIITAMKNESI